jgi:hypothetical protein
MLNRKVEPVFGGKSTTAEPRGKSLSRHAFVASLNCRLYCFVRSCRFSSRGGTVRRASAASRRRAGSPLAVRPTRRVGNIPRPLPHAELSGASAISPGPLPRVLLTVALTG